MRFVALTILLLSLALPVHAQDAQADRTWLENKLQDVLSDAGRDVSITGFQGALSSNARMAQLTISDAQGVWLTLRDAQLVWTRSALLAGRLEIETMTAQEIEIHRKPQTESDLTLSNSQAKPFALPELPVSVKIGTIRVREIRLAEEVLGEPVVLSLEGTVALAGGEGEAALEIPRIDRKDKLTLQGAFSNSSRVLLLNVDFTEDADGMVSRLLNIPGTPALGLKIEGEAPISDYAARIALSSDGAPRFTGKVNVSADEAGAYAMRAELGGDVRPLFAAELHPFFGENSSLLAEGVREPDGATRLDRLEISSGAFELAGALELDADNWPEKFDLRIRVEDGPRVQLPLGGPPTSIASAAITAGFDAARDNTWTASAQVLGLERPGLTLGRAELSGEGQIGALGQSIVTGTLAFALNEVLPTDKALAMALGPAPEGNLSFEWKPDAPLHIAPLVLQSGDTRLKASGFLSDVAGGLPVKGNAEVTTGDLSRFSGLAGRDLRGAAEANLKGSMTLLTGAFDVVLDARTTGLQVGEPRLDPLLGGQTDLTIVAARTEEGTRLEQLRLVNDKARIIASGDLSVDAGALEVVAELADIGLVEPRLDGTAEGEAFIGWQRGQPVRLDQLQLSMQDTRLTASGELDADDPTLPVTGTMRLNADNLSRFARLAGRPLAGSVQLDAKGSGELQGDTFDLAFDLTGSDLRSGIAQLDTLIAGQVSAAGSAALDDTALNLRYLKFTGPRLRLNASGDGPGTPLAVAAQLSDLGLLTTGISGPATARGTVQIDDRLGRDLRLDINATGPGGVAAQINGTVRDYGQSLALDADGSAPLQLVNRFISPRSIEGLAQYDLRIDGPPALSSVSGQVRIAGARASLPNLDYAITDLMAELDLSGGTAQLGLSGALGAGGRFEAQGPISLSSPYAATLDVTLSNLVLTDSELYYTTINGDLGVNGPLIGGALVSGTLNLGTTELRIPSGSGVILGTLPPLTHVAEPADVRATRARAGLIGQDMGNGPGASFPIDLTINAPSRIFVRGRGLDAELGGQLRLTGSTADVIPSGVFQLIRGRLDILGKRLVLTEGLIDLRGALDPYLRFVAEITSDDVLVQVILEGLASAPNVIFTSVPDLPQEEIVARLLFGRGLDSISAFQAAQLVGAVATLTGRFDGGLAGKLRSSLGLSDLDIATTEDGATQLRAGAYISDNIYSEVTADSDGKQQINLNLDLSKTLTVRGRADTEGGSGIGIFFEKDY